MIGPPCIIGKIPLSYFLDNSFEIIAIPPLGPLNVLWVVEVIISAIPTGEGCNLEATKPAIWAISAISNELVSFAICLNF